MATTRLRILATASGVSYYPQYVAQDLGYFADEELEIEAEAPGHGPWGARALVAGSADIALGGIWRPLMYHGRIADFRAFAQLCVRCPAVILGRKPMQRFQWRDLVGKVVRGPGRLADASHCHTRYPPARRRGSVEGPLHPGLPVRGGKGALSRRARRLLYRLSAARGGTGRSRGRTCGGRSRQGGRRAAVERLLRDRGVPGPRRQRRRAVRAGDPAGA